MLSWYLISWLFACYAIGDMSHDLQYMNSSFIDEPRHIVFFWEAIIRFNNAILNDAASGLFGCLLNSTGSTLEPDQMFGLSFKELPSNGFFVLMHWLLDVHYLVYTQPCGILSRPLYKFWVLVGAIIGWSFAFLVFDFGVLQFMNFDLSGVLFLWSVYSLTLGSCYQVKLLSCQVGLWPCVLLNLSS